MIAVAHSAGVIGVDAYPIDVEVSVARGLPAFMIVGLPDPSVQEARERVRAAIVSSGEKWPPNRVTVNLSPAHLRKAGSGFDLAMALGVLCAQGRISQKTLSAMTVLGELSLDGAVRRIRGVLPATIVASRSGKRSVMVPAPNAAEAALVGGIDVLPARHLGEAVRFLRGEATIQPHESRQAEIADSGDELDLSDVRGQDVPKTVLEISAAGGHNLLMMGPPGGGKTMLARRLVGLLPRLSDAEAFEVTRLYSVAGLLSDEHGLVRTRPFRAPHHTVSTGGLVGGGSGVPQAGEVSLAHHGVLFLDELGEFRRDAVQALRGPMEDGVVTVSRAGWSVQYPSRFLLVAASNPCGCGYLGDPVKACSCPPGILASFRQRLSGPILDRIDLHVAVPRPARADLFAGAERQTSSAVRERVSAARIRQRQRFRGRGFSANADIPVRHLDELCVLTPAARRRLEAAVDRFALSARAAHRAMRIARTIADLAQSDAVSEDAIKSAISFRFEVEPG